MANTAPAATVTTAGETPRALGLSPNVDLSRSELLRQRSRGQIFLRITQGYGSMPAFSHKLERGDVELLVDYVLALEAH